MLFTSSTSVFLGYSASFSVAELLLFLCNSFDQSPTQERALCIPTEHRRKVPSLI
ncbi:hypothetical protein BPOR_0209g00030 [Botrytis porri]|uniref:Uncharacterized protein n=1 Tax=Botrytis porri TaxID=87229 RepID=A0A4Z1KTK6_9HELO|nr:hypothetical protein BPOR_0209g00030 [Botrytis porri]